MGKQPLHPGHRGSLKDVIGAHYIDGKGVTGVGDGSHYVRLRGQMKHDFAALESVGKGVPVADIDPPTFDDRRQRIAGMAPVEVVQNQDVFGAQGGQPAHQIPAYETGPAGNQDSHYFQYIVLLMNTNLGSEKNCE